MDGCGDNSERQNVPFQIFHSEARSILSPVSGFLQEAGFTHSLTPARNCTFGCSYCYVPTMRVQAGLSPDDWNRWGHHTTFKTNAAELLGKSLRAGQIIYCSPLTDPYQPAEASERLMPGLLRMLANADRPPTAFVIQTRGPLILRDLDLLLAAARRTRLRVSFSVTTNREDVRRIFEPQCASIEERWRTVAALRGAGIAVFATLAPLLPCEPEVLVSRALCETDGPVVADPFHVRETKRSGATTRQVAIAICGRHGFARWLDPAYQLEVLARMGAVAAAAGREFGSGPHGFALLQHEFRPGT
jgi:DNA repair photolyase